jgi:putative redox protein
LLLMSFAGCSGTAIAFLLRKMGKTVSGLRVKAKGIRRDQPPLKFEKIFLEFTLDSKDVRDMDIQRAIRLAEDSVCPVWQMIKNNVEVTTRYKNNAS